MQQVSHMLAAGEDPTGKIIVGVAVAIFWVVSQVVAAMKKQPDKRRGAPPVLKTPRGASRGTVQQRNRDLPGPRPGILTRTGLSKSAPMKVPTPARPPAAIPPARRAPAVASVPSVPKSSAGRGTSGTIVAAARTVVTKSAERPAPLARNEFVQALLRPRNLRKAYVLTEILQPSVALRE